MTKKKKAAVSQSSKMLTDDEIASSKPFMRTIEKNVKKLLKRKRGRPKKERNPIGAAHGALPKRKRGRPRKAAPPLVPNKPREWKELKIDTVTDALKPLLGANWNANDVMISRNMEKLKSLDRLRQFGQQYINIDQSTPSLHTYPHANDNIIPPNTKLSSFPDPYPDFVSPSPGINSVAIIHWQSTGKSLGLSSMVTAGFLIRKSPDTLTIARTIRRGKYIKKAVFTIPMSLVTKIEKLTEPNLIQIP